DCNLGYYGINCQYSCPATCSQKRCNHVNGACENCNLGRYGMNCQYSCPGKCSNKRCNHVSGS
ncbi:unnamed protein product, partial [Lymnaea stagnalis]